MACKQQRLKFPHGCPMHADMLIQHAENANAVAVREVFAHCSTLLVAAQKEMAKALDEDGIKKLIAMISGWPQNSTRTLDCS